MSAYLFLFLFSINAGDINWCVSQCNDSWWVFWYKIKGYVEELQRKNRGTIRRMMF